MDKLQGRGKQEWRNMAPETKSATDIDAIKKQAYDKY